MKSDGVLTAVLVICSLLTTGVVLWRQFVRSPQSERALAEQGKTFLVPHWQDYLAKGTRIGPAESTVQLIEFADFECPYCGSLHQTLKLMRSRYPTQISITYMHFPLPGHRFALPAARVAECAREQGRFEAMYDQLFEGQESFGLEPWSDYATAAAVPNLAAFDTCVKRTDPVQRVEDDKRLGTKLDIKGTPTLIVNGWMLARPPTAEQLDAMVKAVLAGKSPMFGAEKS